MTLFEALKKSLYILDGNFVFFTHFQLKGTSGVTCLSQTRQMVEFSQKDLGRGGESWRRFRLGEPRGPEGRPSLKSDFRSCRMSSLKYVRYKCVWCLWTGVILKEVVGSLHSGVIWGHRHSGKLRIWKSGLSPILYSLCGFGQVGDLSEFLFSYLWNVKT